MIKILIADDHDVVRKGVRDAVAKASNIAIVGEASNATEILAQMKGVQVDVLVMDITMPRRSGLDVLQEVKSLSPKTEVLIFSMHPEEQFGVPALRMGAAGYLTKASPATEIVKAIETVASGKKYVTPTLAQELARRASFDKAGFGPAKLSAREEEIMRRIAHGQPLTKIAKDLGVTATTVSTYRARLMEKMSVTTNAELARHFDALSHRPRIRAK